MTLNFRLESNKEGKKKEEPRKREFTHESIPDSTPQRGPATWFSVQGLRSGVCGLGFGVWGLGFGVWGLGLRVKGLGSRVEG